MKVKKGTEIFLSIFEWNNRAFSTCVKSRKETVQGF